MLKAITFHSEIRSGSSLPILLSASDGKPYVLKPYGSGDGQMASIVEWLSSQLGIALGLPVLKPVLMRIKPDFLYQAKDPETFELLERSVGINFATPYLAQGQPFNQIRNESISQDTKTLIYLFDLMVLNIDRTLSNPNMIFQADQLWCLDYSSCFAVRNIIQGKTSNTQALLKHLRKHPFYQPEHDFALFKQQITKLGLKVIYPLAQSIPDTWLRNVAVTHQEVSQRLWALCQHIQQLQQRHQSLSTLIPETLEEEITRLDKNRQTFEMKVGKLG